MERLARIAALWAAAGALLLAGRADAWAPYSHNVQGSELIVRMDLPNARLTIGARTYNMAPAVAQAIQAYPSAFFAGTVGPDAFPDIAFGQATIHPAKSGAWVRHLLNSARLAQDPSSGYSAVERGQILAFAYGFAVHAAGDVWGHTLANELSGDVFPEFLDILNPVEIEKRAIAIRHFIIEAAISDATVGKDGNPERGVAPGGYGATSGDISNTSTPGYRYDVPRSFIYRSLIDPAAATPVLATRGRYVDARGPLAGGFLELRDALDAFVDHGLVNPLQAAMDNYDDTLAALDDVADDCNFDGILDSGHDLVACPAALLELGFDFVIDSAGAFWDFMTATAIDLAWVVLHSYVAAWVDDIDAGLQHWTDLNLPVTRALFDAQTLRDRQNEECKYEGDEGSLLRADCEDGISKKGLVLHNANPFIAEHGLSMLGLPDVAGDVYGYVIEVLDEFEEVLAQIGLPFNPIQETLASIEEAMKAKVMEAIDAVLPIDLEAIDALMNDPSRFICASSLPIAFPGSGQVEPILFVKDEHTRLDQYLGISPADHLPAGEGLPAGCGDLKDDVVFAETAFAAQHDTLLLSQLALLPGGELNRVFSDLLGRTVSTWTDTDNVLGPGLGGGSWLEMLDGDHAWRANSWPVFRNQDHALGGKGSFPPWESCVLRSAFRMLFRDWENPWDYVAERGPAPGATLTMFPDHGDPPSEDLVNDPQPPTSSMTLAGTSFVAGGNTYVTASHALTMSVRDLPEGKAFPLANVDLRRRVYPEGAQPPPLAPSFDGEVFAIVGSDGRYYVDHASADPCHTFPDADPRVASPEPTQTASLVLDTTAPVTTCNSPPFGLSYESDDLITIDFTVSDGALGSGVALTTASIDGNPYAAGPVAVGAGMAVDAADYLPGTRTVLVTSTDALGTSGTTACTFEIHATVESLGANLQRAHDSGLIAGDGLYNALLVKLQAAEAAKARGSIGAELNVLGAFVNLLEAQDGKAVDPVVAWQLIAYAEDLIARGG